ncbi:MAG TPA: pyridoxal-phosphate dependent enzyme [Coriobacteriia bacterium]
MTGAPETIPLFRRFPSLAGRVPHVALVRRPTPVQRFEIGGAETWVKRDDLSAEPYGGNKVRKLEFLLAEALAQGATETVTFGAAGSNHALATAVYARSLGLRPISLLAPQPNAAYVRRNLLAQLAVGADVRLFHDGESRERAAVRLLREREAETGRRPFVVAMGGSSPLGTLGFVDAALELAEQIEAGELPLPDLLYVPLGSMGTAAGLILGLRVAGLPTRVVAVRVTPLEWADEAKLAALVAETAKLLRAAGAELAEVPALAWEVRHDLFGEEYARFTSAGMAGVEAARTAGMHLEGTYTGKTMAALLADARSGALGGSGTLFWDTYSSRDLGFLTAAADWRDLPEGCRAYFTEPLQELDS